MTRDHPWNVTILNSTAGRIAAWSLCRFPLWWLPASHHRAWRIFPLFLYHAVFISCYWLSTQWPYGVLEGNQTSHIQQVHNHCLNALSSRYKTMKAIQPQINKLILLQIRSPKNTQLRQANIKCMLLTCISTNTIHILLYSNIIIANNTCLYTAQYGFEYDILYVPGHM